MKIFIGTTATSKKLLPMDVDDFKDVCFKYLNNPMYGTKDGLYFTTASEVREINGEYNRSDEHHLKSWCIVIDGDKSVNNDESCIKPIEVHRVLKRLKINHSIYTTYSHHPEKEKYKWRLVIPCQLTGVEQHRSTVAGVYKLLFDKGLTDLVAVSESFRMSQLWYLHRSENPDLFEYFDFHGGSDFFSQTTFPDNWQQVPGLSNPSTSTQTHVDGGAGPGSDDFLSKNAVPEEEMVKTIVLGLSPLHETMNRYIYGRTKDGLTVPAIKAILHGFTDGWNLSDARLSARKKDIDRLVEYAAKKFKDEINKESSRETFEHWCDKKEEDADVDIETELKGMRPTHINPFTDYPDQGGNMEKLVQCCMKWMRFPNRQIAVISARALISTLGARVYTYPNGNGIALTALVTGRSTIGKSNIKKFFIWMMNSFQMANTSHEFLGSQYYTSAANLVKDLNSKSSLLSIRTESGQSDRSTAGDMTRVMAYELEFSTASGIDGYISSGAQNEKIPELYSPGVTTIRESVAEIQSAADALKQSDIAGTSGRRSLVIISKIKSSLNKDRLLKPPKELKELIAKLYNLASVEARKDCTKPLKRDLWIFLKIEHQDYLDRLYAEWRDKENRAAIEGDDYESTFYGRLLERTKAYAGSLAVADNPTDPIVTNTHIDIAVSSLIAELNGYKAQEESGMLEDPMSRAITNIERLFHGDLSEMLKYYKPSLHKIAKKEIDMGAIEWVPISKKLQRILKPLDKHDKDRFFISLKTRLSTVDIDVLTSDQTFEMFGHRRKTLKRL